MLHVPQQRGSGTWLGIVLIALALAGCTAVRTTGPTPSIPETSPAMITPDTPPAAVATEAPAQPAGAPSTPLVVRWIMDKAPKLNEEVDVVLEIQAYLDAPGTTARIELPPEARLVSGELLWQGDVLTGAPVRIPVRITFTQVGEFTVRGRAIRTVNADMVWGDEDAIFLTVKQDSGHFGFESGDNLQLSASPVPDTRVITAQAPVEALQELIGLVEEFNLQQGIQNNLDAKLAAALQALDDLSENDDAAAINSLEAFINAVEAQWGKELTDAQADELVKRAQAIIDSLPAPY